MKSKWKFIAGGAIEPLIHKEIWAETFLKCLNDKNFSRSYLVVRKGSWSSEYVLTDELQEVFNASRKFIQPDFFDKFLKSSGRVRYSFWETAKEFRSGNIRCLDREQLAYWFDKYLDVFRGIAVHFWATQSDFFQYLEKIFRENLKNKVRSRVKLEEAISILTSPTKLTIIEKEEIALHDLARRDLNYQEITKHANKHPWLFFNTFNRKEIINFLKQKIKAAKFKDFDKTDLLTAKRKLCRKQKSFLKELRNERIKYLSFFFKEMAIERFKLKACWAGVPFVFLSLFEQIAKVLESDLSDLIWFWTAAEISAGLKNNFKISGAEIAKRKLGYVLWLNKGKTEFSCGKLALAVIDKQLSKDSFRRSKRKVITGTVASFGKVQGKVRIIHIEDLYRLKEDWKNFRKGEIMIVTMTQPNMMPIIRKAAAVVTEEGGITSRAAIICRELKIPCVVGTGTATHIFRTGDVIEVDAEKGIVSLI